MNVFIEKLLFGGCFLYFWGENVFYFFVINLKIVVFLFIFVLKNIFEMVLFIIYMLVFN